ncbi:prenyltransferase/squalene oxidase repeat-containing protein [Haliangium sp.]|uniref:prenyltransferase/squalene oxidase repeat-containing protein n=1 Tax=Haliangium sp. TaxID=2663208 RepID=UPI003D13E565
MSPRPLPRFAALAVAIALTAPGCKSRPQPPSDPAAAPADAATPTAPAVSPPSPTSAPSVDRWAAAIERNLPTLPDPALAPAQPRPTLSELDNQRFRDRVIALVRAVSAAVTAPSGDPAPIPCALPDLGPAGSRPSVRIYRDGALIGRGESAGPDLCVALKEATRRALAAIGPDRGDLGPARFAVDLVDHGYGVLEFEGRGLEMIYGLIPVRELDKDLLEARVAAGKEYLLRVIEPDRHGVHKYYYAPEDRFEDRLHTIYTASTIYTLIKLHARAPNKKLRATIRAAAEFLLSMQSDVPESSGSFYYSLDLTTGTREPRWVVGTTSKTIFTLLALDQLERDPRYRKAAIRAADWLLAMMRPDGRVRAYLRRTDDGRWLSGKKESLLYTGQTLSALSRMYAATDDTRYLDGAAQIASRLIARVEREGCYLGDDYRTPNPISSSWVVLSLFDHARARDHEPSWTAVRRCADELLERQLRDPADAYRYGRWPGSLSSSGNGWLAEVMSELYLACRARPGAPSLRASAAEGGGCDRFREAIVGSLRLIAQHTYTPESAFVAKNPAAAIGGVFWNSDDRYVRTDAVAHAMNAYLNVIDLLDRGPLVSLPEPPLAERLSPTTTQPSAPGRGAERQAPPGATASTNDGDDDGAAADGDDE